jgi:hypothetical protein
VRRLSFYDVAETFVVECPICLGDLGESSERAAPRLEDAGEHELKGVPDTWRL